MGEELAELGDPLSYWRLSELAASQQVLAARGQRVGTISDLQNALGGRTALELGAQAGELGVLMGEELAELGDPLRVALEHIAEFGQLLAHQNAELARLRAELERGATGDEQRLLRSRARCSSRSGRRRRGRSAGRRSSRPAGRAPPAPAGSPSSGLVLLLAAAAGGLSYWRLSELAASQQVLAARGFCRSEIVPTRWPRAASTCWLAASSLRRQ
jgi:hypothetical protein